MCWLRGGRWSRRRGECEFFSLFCATLDFFPPWKVDLGEVFFQGLGREIKLLIHDSLTLIFTYGRDTDIDGTEFEHFDRTLDMLNQTAGLCLRI